MKAKGNTQRHGSPRGHVAYRHYLGKTRQCNLCRHEFAMRTVFDRFCGTCKAEKDIFRFAEWMPNLSLAM